MDCLRNRFLVASRAVRDLLLCAKHLFVAAMVGNCPARAEGERWERELKLIGGNDERGQQPTRARTREKKQDYGFGQETWQELSDTSFSAKALPLAKPYGGR